MIARPRYEWTLPGNVDAVNNEITITVDIEMLEKIIRRLRSTVQDLAFSDRYDQLKNVIDDYLKLEKLSAIYYQMREEQEREEQNDDNVSEEQS